MAARLSARSSPGSSSPPAARGGSDSPSSCCRTAARTLLDHTLATARACALRPAARARSAARRTTSVSGVDLTAPRSSSTTATATGCSSSIAAALGGVDPRSEVLVLLLGDQPGVTADDRARAARAAAATPRWRSAATTTAAATRSRSGAPSSASSRALHGDKAVWKLLRAALRGDVAEVPIAGPVPLDVDTWDDYQAVLAARDAGRRRRAVGRDPRSRRCRRALRRRPTTSPTRASRPRCSSRSRLPQPLLLEGEAGVGKTEAAKALAAALDTPLIRLQCYEGIDAAEALYEWNYPRQLLRIRLAEAAGDALAEDELFGRDYLVRRPLLRAIEHPGPLPAVLLIDELDRADDDFEAFLLELLAEASRDDPRARARSARRTRRSWSSPPTARATCTTRSSAAASTTGSTTRAAEREAEIVRRRVPGASRRAGAATSPAPSRRAARGRRAEAAGHRRGDRLGRGARAARRRPARRGGGGAHARRGAQVPRGPGARARARPRALAWRRARCLTRSPSVAREPRWPPASAARCTTPACPCTPERAGCASPARCELAPPADARRALLDGARGRSSSSPRAARRRSTRSSRASSTACADPPTRAATRHAPPPRAPSAARPRRAGAADATARRRARHVARSAGRRAPAGATATTSERDVAAGASPAPRSGSPTKDFAELDADELAARAAADAPAGARPRRVRRTRRCAGRAAAASVSTCARRCGASHRTGGDPVRLAAPPPARARRRPLVVLLRRLRVDGALLARLPAAPAGRRRRRAAPRRSSSPRG